MYAIDYLKGRAAESTTLIETSLAEVQRVFDVVKVPMMLYKYSKLEPLETLKQHVKRMMKTPETCIGPASETSLIYKSPHHTMPQMRSMSLQEAGRALSGQWRNVAAFSREWQTILKSLASGVFSPLVSRGVHFGAQGEFASYGFIRIFWPLVLQEADGLYWGMLGQPTRMTDEYRLEWSLYDILTVKHASSFISVVNKSNGQMMWQNPASSDLFGYHGQFNSELTPEDGAKTELDQSPQYNFLDLMFGPDEPLEDGSQSLQTQMRSIVEKGGTFRVTIQVTNPILRSLMSLADDREMHLDSQVSQTSDPRSLQKVYILSQTGVTATVLAQHELEITRERLEAEKVKTECLLHQQRELIDCLSWVSEVSSSAGGNTRASQLIDSIRKQLTATVDGVSTSSSSDINAASISLGDSIEVNELIGQGSFGQVFKGKWRDITVAVKSMILPVKMAGTEKKERMALMEAAISSSLVHKNIIRTHTYSIKPMRDKTSASQLSILSQEQATANGPGSFGSIQSFNSAPLNGPVTAFEVKIVLEYCNLGSLSDALKAGTFHPASKPNYPVILEMASDIAEGCRHLHSRNIIHADLKTSNVLLQSCDSKLGFMAKISDFGLSITKMDSAETHVSGLYQGTLTHMSPETLTTGQQSNAGDVYSFAITLYELYTATLAFRDVPLTFLGHRVAKEQLRPVFPPDTPSGFKVLKLRS